MLISPVFHYLLYFPTPAVVTAVLSQLLHIMLVPEEGFFYLTESVHYSFLLFSRCPNFGQRLGFMMREAR